MHIKIAAKILLFFETRKCFCIFFTFFCVFEIFLVPLHAETCRGETSPIHIIRLAGQYFTGEYDAARGADER
jgi:hypothetical protein